MALNDKCRVCISVLNKSNDTKFDLLQEPQLAHKFKTCTNLPTIEEDFPSRLCEMCYHQVEQFYTFRNRCIVANEYWSKQKFIKNSSVITGNAGEKPLYDLEAFKERTVDLTDNSKHPDDEENKRIRHCTPTRRKNITLKCPSATDTSDREEEQVPGADQQQQQQQTYQCDVCPTRFFVKHRLVAHKRRHDGLIPYPCTQVGCERGFNRLHCLSEHLKQHAGTSSWYSCDQDGCNKSYKHKPTLVMHLRKYHKLGPELKSHVCEFCGKVFKSSAVLNDHRYTHKDKSELPHACVEPNCARRFSTKEKLKVHMMRHAGIKNFSCPHCGLRKTTRNELKIHINYHTLERTWACVVPTCSKVCNSAGNLKTHVRTVHERAKDYACSYCERSFAKPDTRKYHEMTHTGEKPNECQECGKRFTQPAALRTHRKIHQRQRSSEIETETVVVND